MLVFLAASLPKSMNKHEVGCTPIPSMETSRRFRIIMSHCNLEGGCDRPPSLKVVPLVSCLVLNYHVRDRRGIGYWLHVVTRVAERHRKPHYDRSFPTRHYRGETCMGTAEYTSRYPNSKFRAPPLSTNKDGYNCRKKGSCCITGCS